MGAPLFIVLCGYPGVGKSTVASLIAEETGAEVYDSDRVRKELFENPTYSSEESRIVYEELVSRGREAIEDDRTVVLDATFSRESRRKLAENMADELGVDILYVRVKCEEEVVKDRIRKRDGISNADFEVYQVIKESFDPLERDHATIDNSGSLGTVKDQVREIFADA